MNASSKSIILVFSILCVTVFAQGCSSLSDTYWRVKTESLNEPYEHRFAIPAPPQKTWRALKAVIKDDPKKKNVMENDSAQILVWEVETEIKKKKKIPNTFTTDKTRSAIVLQQQPRGYVARVIPTQSGSYLFCRGNILWTNHPLITSETIELVSINQEQKKIANDVAARVRSLITENDQISQ